MGASNGTIIGLTKILDNGANNLRHNIVLVAEGFRDSEQDDFNDLCDEFLTYLAAEPWFPELGKALNLFRLNVASDESGADDPATCPDGNNGSGNFVDTYFDATYCNSGIRRCLSGSETLVRNTIDDHLSEWHTAAVLVNSAERGGCASGNVFWSAISSDWKEVVMHELGHASFALADEYNTWAGCDSGETGHDVAPAFEPEEVNVTAQTSRDQIKWRYFINQSTPIPTMLNPDCSQCDERSNVLGSDQIIGLYEGAKYYHCGYFRPAYTCRMRKSSQPFCRVCIDGIARRLFNFIDDAPVLEVVPNLLEFGDVAHGLTLYRSFEVRNVKAGCPVGITIRLSAIAGDAGFSYPPGTELSFRLPAPVFEAYTSQTVYIAFTSIDDGTPNAIGSLEVSIDEFPGITPQIVNLSGRAIAPPPVDSVLVIDRSDSMDGETGVPGERKIDHAIDAAKLYVSLLKDNDRIGVVRYNHEARNPEDILLTMRLANGPGKSLADSVLNLTNLAPDGFTTIGGGVILGSEVLENGTSNSRAIVVLTDGIQNRDPDIPEATGIVMGKSPRQRVFAVGLGLNQLEDKLQQIASFTEGVAQITGDLVLEKEFLLQKLYVQILSDISDEAFVRDPRQMLYPRQQQATNLHLGEVDVAADFILVFRSSPLFPKYLNVWLEAPDGTELTLAELSAMPNATVVVQNSHLYIRMAFPVFPDRPEMHIGTWKMWVGNYSGRQYQTTHDTAYHYGGEPFYYSVMCKARSNFRLGGRVFQASYLPGSTMRIQLHPTLYGLPIPLREPVRVTVTRPDQSKTMLTLQPNAAGGYETTYAESQQIGVYLFQTEVGAVTPRNHYITRFRTMTGVIFIPGATKPGGDSSGGGRDGELEKLFRECCKKLGGKLDDLNGLLKQQLDDC